MFFSGSLQEALASAVQNDKAVVCFVTGEQKLQCWNGMNWIWLGTPLLTAPLDDGDESQTWENEYLKEESVSAWIYKILML